MQAVPEELRSPLDVPRSRPVAAPPRGRVLSVVGPDGVGKSTLIDRLMLGRFASVPVKHMRWPSVLPRRSRGQGPVTEPHKNPPYSRPVSLLKTTYVFLDYCAGWLFRVRPHVRRGGWVLIQRGWWDMAVDPLRYRLDVPSTWLMRLGRFLPVPDLILVLEAPTITIRERKEELSAAELKDLFTAQRVVDCPAGDIPDRVVDALRDQPVPDFVAVAGGDGTLRGAAERAVVESERA